MAAGLTKGVLFGLASPFKGGGSRLVFCGRNPCHDPAHWKRRAPPCSTCCLTPQQPVPGSPPVPRQPVPAGSAGNWHWHCVGGGRWSWCSVGVAGVWSFDWIWGPGSTWLRSPSGSTWLRSPCAVRVFSWHWHCVLPGAGAGASANKVLGTRCSVQQEGAGFLRGQRQHQHQHAQAQGTRGSGTGTAPSKLQAPLRTTSR
jgi:hypothetical protein